MKLGNSLAQHSLPALIYLSYYVYHVYVDGYVTPCSIS